MCFCNVSMLFIAITYYCCNNKNNNYKDFFKKRKAIDSANKDPRCRPKAVFLIT